MPRKGALAIMPHSQRECIRISARESWGSPSSSERLRKALARITRDRYIDGKTIEAIACRWAKRLVPSRSHTHRCLATGFDDYCSVVGMFRGRAPFPLGTNAASFFRTEVDRERRKRNPRPIELIILDAQLRYPT